MLLRQSATFPANASSAEKKSLISKFDDLLRKERQAFVAQQEVQQAIELANFDAEVKIIRSEFQEKHGLLLVDEQSSDKIFKEETLENETKVDY